MADREFVTLLKQVKQRFITKFHDTLDVTTDRLQEQIADCFILLPLASSVLFGLFHLVFHHPPLRQGNFHAAEGVSTMYDPRHLTSD